MPLKVAWADQWISKYNNPGIGQLKQPCIALENFSVHRICLRKRMKYIGIFLQGKFVIVLGKPQIINVIVEKYEKSFYLEKL